ncbi:MAG: ribonuclease H-like domain-containing protein [Candidatus Krumholzibacteriota bacterium]|nr:ribonuclease H-like domain-containing protein [Candidatus Krumholzibacteriota bacterium]
MTRRGGDLRVELEELRRRAAAAFGRRRPLPGIGPPPGEGGAADASGILPGPFSGIKPPPEEGGAASDAAQPTGTLEALVPGAEAPGGGFYRVREDAAAIWPSADRFLAEYREALAGPFPPENRGLEELRLLAEAETGRVLWLDLETTGLSMAPLFLVGLMYEEGNRLVVDQLFARDYAEEAAVLLFAAETMARFDTLVTYNGLRFDVPFLAGRMAYTSLPFRPPRRHVDLLRVARRAVGRRTPNHRLQTLERHLLGMKRAGDVPGREIPGVYHEFVRTGDAGGIAGVILHNRLDLVTMLKLVTVFLSGCR